MGREKILIVEDDAIIAMQLENCLTDLGYQVVSIANSGEKAIEQAQLEKPHLILMDIQIKGKMDGIEAANLIRSQLDIPVIFSTAYFDEERIKKAKITMPFGYLLKPIQKRDLQVAIEMALYVSKVDKERKQAEEALQRSENRYRTVSELTSDYAYAYQVKPDGTLVNEWVTGAFSHLTGYSRQEISVLGGWEFLMHPADKQIAEDQLKALYNNQAKTVEYRIIIKSGQTRLVRDYARPRWDPVEKRITGIEGAVQDITPQQVAEAQIVETNIRLITILDSMPADIYVSDMETHEVLFMNAQMKESFGKDLTGQICWKAFRKGTEPCAFCTNSKLLDTENRPAETQIWEDQNPISRKYYLNHDKAIRWLDDRFVRIQIAIDITTRREAEKALRDSEDKMRSIFQVAPTGIGMVKNRVLYEVNPQICEMTGYTKEELIGKSARILYPTQEEFEYVGEEKYRQVADRGTGMVETQWQKKNGAILEILLASTPIDTNDQSKGVTFTALDISQRLQAEEALKDSEEKYRNVVDNAIEGICVVQDNRFKYFNPETIKLFGYSSEELEQLPASETIFKEDRDLTISRRLQREQGEQILSAYAHRILTKDHRVRWVDIKAVMISWSGQPATLVFLTDVTERKQSERLMMQTEKMMSVGGLAAGMAHELNNPLAGILQGVQNVQRRLSPDLASNLELAREIGIDLDKLQLYMETRGIRSFFNGIQESGKKASEIISNMLQFSRKSESRMAPIDLSKLMENVLELAGKDYDLKKKFDFRKIKIIKEFPSIMPKVHCTETEIEQVMLNLLANATWAMASEKNQAAPQITLRIVFEDKEVRIEVEDNGPGIDEETRKRVFEPFYTTKPVGEGTGLGLSVSFMIITNNHKGKMEVESEIGSGARFIIRLPCENKALSKTSHG